MTWLAVLAVLTVVGLWVWAMRKWLHEEPELDERNRGVVEHMRAIQSDPLDDVWEPDTPPYPDAVSGNPEIKFTYDSPVERVVSLWNREGGWIPGAAYRDLAQALGVDTDRLTHHEQGVGRVAPGTHRFFSADIYSGERALCAVIVNGARCNKTYEEHQR